MKINLLIEKVIFPSTYVNKRKLHRSLSGKTIIITGTSSGIGEQLVYLLGDINCHLIVVARRKDKLLEIQKKISTAKVSIFAADLRDEDSRMGFLLFLNNLVSIDYFVNNAGISINRSIYDSLNRFHDFQRTMAINYFAPVEILLSIIPRIEESNGQIINVSTINSLLLPFPRFAAYRASKQAFDTWLRSVLLELNANGIVTTSIYLPLVRTPMIEPTNAYKNMPAMNPGHAAKIISKLMYTQKRTYKPWWIIGGQIITLLFRGVLEKTWAKCMKKR